MVPHKTFFYSGLFFIAGVALKSLGLGFEVLVLNISFTFSCFVTYYFHRNKKLIFLSLISLFLIFGAFYYQWDHNKFLDSEVPYNQHIEVQAKISNNPKIIEYKQRFEASLLESYEGTILIFAPPYPEFQFGDYIEIEGTIEKPGTDSYGDYLKSQKVAGSIYFPEIEKFKQKSFSIKKYLLSISNKAEEIYKEFLSPEEAAFLNGITFGGYDGMTEDFRANLQKSGTTHLVALSGFHVTIILATLMSFFLYFLPRRVSLLLTFSFMAVFIVIAGARISIIRASIMGFLAAFAQEAGRIYDPKNSTLLAALFFVILNPKVLIFDVGFQLSFLALLGILYFRPVLAQQLNIEDEKGVFNWKNNFLTTTSAQLAVAPILLLNFDQFSFIAVLTNIAVLELIPLTMGLGFLLFLSGLLFYYPTLIVGWLVSALIAVEISIIEFFASLDLVLYWNLGVTGALAYYTIGIWLIYRNYKLNRK